jgi:hypothetical protein
MSVRKFLRRETDVNHSRSNSTVNASELERPLSEYDNIKPPTSQTHFPLGDIKFRFDDLPSTTKAIMNSSNNVNPSAVHYNNRNGSQQTTTLPARYENVLDTLQMRNKRESNQQVKMNQNDERSPSRSVMSDAKSSFFGLNQQQSSAVDEFDRLIEDIGNATIVSNDQNQYVNLPNEFQSSSQEKVSATSSASGSSSTTATPSASPTRQERTGSSRKNSEGSNRSKSPKFMLPEVTSPSSMSQVCK